MTDYRLNRKGRRVLAKHYLRKARERRDNGLCAEWIVHPNSQMGLTRLFCNGLLDHGGDHRYGGIDDVKP